MQESISFTALQMLRSFLWAILAAVTFAISLVLAIKIFDLFTPEIKELAEIKKDNKSAAFVIGCLIIAIAFLISRVI